MDISGLNSFYNDYITQQKDSSATSKLEQKLSTDYSSASDEELMSACKQFEAYFVEQVFKGMEKTIMKSEESSSANTPLIDYFKDNTIQTLAEQSTEQTDLGLAQMMYEQMKRNYSI